MEKNNEGQQQQDGPRPCRMKKSNPDATFLEDMKDHLSEFVSASMEDHKNCFINTFGKMFAKAPKEEAASTSAEPPVLATTSK